MKYWAHRTRTGTIKYERAKHFFSDNDIQRILKNLEAPQYTFPDEEFTFMDNVVRIFKDTFNYLTEGSKIFLAIEEAGEVIELVAYEIRELLTKSTPRKITVLAKHFNLSTSVDKHNIIVVNRVTPELQQNLWEEPDGEE